MPLYEYRCTQCGHQFEHIQTYSAPDVKECPVCQSPVERLISAPNMHFVGSGFYETDYKNKSKRGATASGSAPSTSASSDTSSAAPDISSAGPATPKAPASSTPASGASSSTGSSSPKGS